MYLGVDYYPEHWPEEMLQEDIKGIKGLGANIVRIGEFAWHLMEKEEGKFDFSFFDKVIAELKREGLSVMFGTPTATFPAWLAKKHPSILSEYENGQKRVFGGRRQYCFNSPIYRQYSARITEELVKHYANEEAIMSWQIDNEFGHEGSDMCYCDQCHNGFQLFLKNNYNSIDELNDRWGTIFWGQTYNDFNEIPIPKSTITTHNPSLQLEWARFRSYSINSYAHQMYEITRKHKGGHQQVTTNVSGGFFNKWFDHAENVRTLDFVSYDNYPVWGGLAEPISPAAIALTHDFNRGLLGKNYWIVEELMGAQGHNVIGYLPRPNQAKMWSYQAFAHGCNNLLYFRWRGMTKGTEQFCYGIVDHDNRYGRKYKEVQSVFEDVKQFKEVIDTDIKADIAVLYDYDNIWSWRFQTQSENFDFTNELLRLYTPFYKMNTHIDVIPTDRDFSNYKVLLVPVLQIIEEELANRFRAFTENGGTIIFSFRTGLKNKDNNIYLKQSLPGHVTDITGIRVEEIESLSGSQVAPVVSANGKNVYNISVWRDIIVPEGAEVVYQYGDTFYKDFAAVTKNPYKNGTVYYIGGGLEEAAIQPIIEDVLNQHQIWHEKTDDEVEVYKRNDHVFIMNHSSETKYYKDIELPPFASRIQRQD